MSNGPSREDRRAYENSGKDAYYDNQENVLFPQAQADIWKQVGQRGQALDQWAFQQQQQKDAYKDQVKFQNDSYKNQIEAFEKSDDIYQANQKYIQKAYDRKVGEADAQLEETVRSGYFDLDAAQRKFGLDQFEAQTNVNRNNLSIDKMQLQRETLQKQSDQRQAQFSAQKDYIQKQRGFNSKGFKNTIADIEQQKLRNQQGYDIRNNLLKNQIEDNESSYLSNKALYDDQIQSNVDNYDREIAYLDKTITNTETRATNDIEMSKYERDISERNRKQTVAELTAQKNYLTAQRKFALEEKTSRDSQIDRDYQDKVNSGMYEKLTNKIQSIVDQGQISSRGSRGRSVANTLNATIAAAGFNGARLSEGLLSAGVVRDTQKDESKTAYGKLLAGITQDETNNASRKKREEDREAEIKKGFTLKEALIEDNASSQKDDIKNRKNVAEESKDDRAAALKNTKKQNLIQRDQTEDNLRANKKENLLNKRTTNDRLKFNKKDAILDNKETKANLGYDLEQAKLNNISDKYSLNQNRKQLNKDIQDTKERNNLIAAQLGFTAEQLEMTQEQLGESILSATQANKRTKSNLKAMAKQENLSAFYQRMARPKFNALPKPPYEVAMPKFAPVVKMASPGEFLNASDSGYLNASRPASGPSGISKALSIGGMVLGAVAAPFTAGASLAGTGALMSAGTAAAVSGGGALLGGLGKSGLFD